MGAKDILAELEMLGAVGSKVVPLIKKPVVQSVTLESAAPSPQLLDERGKKMMQYCDRAISLIDSDLQLKQEMKSLFEEMRDLWTESEENPEQEAEEEAYNEVQDQILPEDGPGDEEEGSEEPAEEEEADDEFPQTAAHVSNQSAFGDILKAEEERGARVPSLEDGG